MKEHQEMKQVVPGDGEPELQKQKVLQKKQSNNCFLKITYYTDPLCCWSWAFEKSWFQLLDEFDDDLDFEYVMCGMIPDWSTYNDPMNSVSKPIQMGPVWMHASEVTQVKMKYSIWFDNPPTSSYPACIAVKTAGLQSKSAADQYLHDLRRALMEDGENISQRDILFSIARKMKHDGFSFDRFLDDWRQQRGIELFRQDIQKAKYHNIGRYPTLTFTNTEGKGILLTGYRPYNVLKDAFLHARNQFAKIES